MSQQWKIPLRLYSLNCLIQLYRSIEIRGLHKQCPAIVANRQHVPGLKPFKQQIVHHVLRCKMKSDLATIRFLQILKSGPQHSGRVRHILHDMRSEPNLFYSSHFIYIEHLQRFIHRPDTVIHSRQYMAMPINKSLKVQRTGAVEQT